LLAFLLVLGRKTWRHQRSYSVSHCFWNVTRFY